MVVKKMKNYCGKCGSKINSDTGLCPKCNKDLLAVQNEKNIAKKEDKKKKIKAPIYVIGVLLGYLCLMVGLVYFEVVNIPVISDLMKKQNLEDVFSGEEYIELKALEQANQECIVIEEKNIEMKNEKEGTATIIISIPNYEHLYKEALQAEDSDEYLLNALKEKDFLPVEYEEEVPVTVENSETIIHSEEIVSQILEEELIKAINALAEGEKYNEEDN